VHDCGTRRGIQPGHLSIADSPVPLDLPGLIEPEYSGPLRRVHGFPFSASAR